VVWPVVGVLAVVLTVEEWDMPGPAVAGVLLGTAAAYALCGLLLWVPAAAWVSRRLPLRPPGPRVVPLAVLGLFALLGAVIGAGVCGLLVLASGNATWPSSLGVVAQNGAAAGVASVLGWVVASAVRRLRGRSVDPGR
jgi:asparagine N-glycosylation enzyme membrane subunit Stt3